jgi:hypothetical protein
MLGNIHAPMLLMQGKDGIGHRRFLRDQFPPTGSGSPAAGRQSQPPANRRWTSSAGTPSRAGPCRRRKLARNHAGPSAYRVNQPGHGSVSWEASAARREFPWQRDCVPSLRRASAIPASETGGRWQGTAGRRAFLLPVWLAVEHPGTHKRRRPLATPRRRRRRPGARPDGRPVSPDLRVTIRPSRRGTGPPRTAPPLRDGPSPVTGRRCRPAGRREPDPPTRRPAAGAAGEGPRGRWAGVAGRRRLRGAGRRHNRSPASLRHRRRRRRTAAMAPTRPRRVPLAAESRRCRGAPCRRRCGRHCRHRCRRRRRSRGPRPTRPPPSLRQAGRQPRRSPRPGPSRRRMAHPRRWQGGQGRQRGGTDSGPGGTGRPCRR